MSRQGPVPPPPTAAGPDPARAAAPLPGGGAALPPAPVPSPAPALRAGWITALLLGLVLGVWGTQARIDGAILAQGQIAASATRRIVQHPEGGRVVALAVAEGDRVAAGAELLRLDDSLLAAERAVLETRRAAALARAARLTAERDGALRLPDPPAAAGPEMAAHWAGQAQLFEARRAALAGQIAVLDHRRDQTRARLAGLAAQRRALQAEIATQAEDLARQEGLAAAGLLPATRLAGPRREALRLAAAAAALDAETAEAEARLAEYAAQAAALVAAHRQEAEAGLRELGAELAELDARRRVLDDRIAAQVLRAPVAGRVHALAVGGVGAVLRPGEAAAEIVPDGPGPVALVPIRPDDIDRLHPGQPARLVLPATGGREPLELPARIVRLPAEAHQDPGSGARMFRVEIAPDPDAPLPPDRVLHPGLAVEARILTGARSPLAWLLAPLTVYVDRALSAN
jgi:HlyD family secretion protein